MKQIIQSFRSGKMEIAEVPMPQCLPGGVVVKVIISLISAGTEKMLVDFSRKSLVGKAQERPDLVRQVLRKAKQEGYIATMKKVFNKLDTPIPLGYSAAGIVVEVGNEVTDLTAGDRVAIAGAGYANHAEYDFVPRNLVNKIPAEVSFEDAAFTTVAAIGLQGIRKAAPTLGERVGVLGLGLIGQLTVMMLKGNGCKVIGFDPDPEKAKLAAASGIDVACAADIESAAHDFSGGFGLDSVIITAATTTNKPLITAGEIVKPKGTVVMVGMMPIEIPRDIYYKKELDFRMATSYGPGRYDPTYEEMGCDYPFSHVRWTEGRNMQAVLEMVASGILRTGHLKTHRFAIADAERAYEMIETGSEKYTAVLLTYPGNTPDAVVPPQSEIRLKPAVKKEGALRVGFVGCGNFAQAVLIPAFLKHRTIQAVAIASKSGFSAYSAGKKFGVETVYPDMASMLEKESLDAVVISTRHDLHAAQTVTALEKKIAVFVEKPLALSADELARVKRAQEQSGAVLQVGFNRRFSPLVERIRAELPARAPLLIDYAVNAGVIPNEVWIHDRTVGGGRIIGEVCHFIDLCAAFTGSTVTEVFARSVAPKGSGYRPDDNLSILLTMASGDTAVITYHAMGGASLPKERITLTAGNRSFVVENFKSLHRYSDRHTVSESTSQEKGFGEEVAAFVAGVKNGMMPISIESLFNTTMATFAIEESLAKGVAVKVLG